MRVTLCYSFHERGRNGDGGRSVSRLVFLTSTRRVNSRPYYYYWRREQDWDRCGVSLSGRSNLSLVVGLVRRGIAPKWCSAECGLSCEMNRLANAVRMRSIRLALFDVSSRLGKLSSRPARPESGKPGLGHQRNNSGANSARFRRQTSQVWAPGVSTPTW